MAKEMAGFISDDVVMDEFLAGYDFAAEMSIRSSAAEIRDMANDPHICIGDSWDMGFALGCQSAFGR